MKKVTYNKKFLVNRYNLKIIFIPEEAESKQEGSGDSSPSREVEKILSLNDVDCFDTYFDDENDTVADDGVVDCVNGLDDKIDETETKPEITDTTQLNRDKWPEAPMAALLPNMTDDRDALRKISQTLTQLVGRYLVALNLKIFSLTSFKNIFCFNCFYSSYTLNQNLQFQYL